MIRMIGIAAAMAAVAGWSCSSGNGPGESAPLPASESASAPATGDDASPPDQNANVEVSVEPEDRSPSDRKKGDSAASGDEPGAKAGDRPFLDPFGDGGMAAPRREPPAGPGLDAARERVRVALERMRRDPDAAIETSSRAGPGGTGIVSARFSGAYPGTGVAALIYDPDSETTYGKRGERDLAALFQSRGWLDDPLADSEVIELVHFGHYDGVLILQGERVERREDGLRVTLPAHTMRSRLRATYVVDIPAKGDIVISER
jgi:hypothetical protein